MHKKLLNWYSQNKRNLPWRNTNNPYFIWISEVMLQQTTTKAVLPYYDKFLQKFPDVKSLAIAELEDVYEKWSGLGYYSRARNLHLASQKISKNGFPKTYLQFLELPGFGPYTSRAVSSFAFNELVGVLDGNVIRVLTRAFNLKINWWENKSRTLLQKIVDDIVIKSKTTETNNALMELGSLICTSQNPMCGICPLNKNCLALKYKTINLLPLKKPKKENEIWVWDIDIEIKNKKLKLIKDHKLPFLKKFYIPPGKIKLHSKKPLKFDIQHQITHHSIFVRLNRKSLVANNDNQKFIFTPIKILYKKSPSSLLKKIMEFYV